MKSFFFQINCTILHGTWNKLIDVKIPKLFKWNDFALVCRACGCGHVKCERGVGVSEEPAS